MGNYNTKIITLSVTIVDSNMIVMEWFGGPKPYPHIYYSLDPKTFEALPSIGRASHKIVKLK